MADSQQDDFQQARERYDDAREAQSENRHRWEEDLRFSNPADPKQWEQQSVTDRKGRPTLTMDNTNQFIQQVVNDGRRNTPSIQTLPSNDGADVLVSEQLNGILRHIEYASRASTAYDTALEYSARVGQGWLLAAPKMIDGERNYQEPRVYGCDDPLAGCLDGDSVEYDGSDAMFGFYESTMSTRAFKAKWPKAQISSFAASDGWFDEKGTRVCQYWRVIETQKNQIEVEGTDGQGSYILSEEDYWEAAKKTGVKPQVIGDPFMAKVRTVKHYFMSGVDFLEETDFPSKYIGLVPVYGHVLRVDGKRYVCGLTRRLRDGQKFHNYQMSSLAETLLSQPKNPFMAPGRAIVGYEPHWENFNSGNPAYLPYNDIDDEGNPVSAPQRLAAPQFPVAFGNAAQLGIGEMQAAVGMYKSNLGQQSNAVSGKAKLADKSEGDNATFNFHDNQRRSLEQLGRILVDMSIKLIDTPRMARILSLDGNKTSFMKVDPDMGAAVLQDSKGKVIAINPSIGEYDVRVKTGPSYATQHEELQDRLTMLGQGNPQLAAALAPLLVKMADMPDSERIAKICLALLPPPVQAAYNDDDEQDNIPAAVKQQMQSMQQQLQQASQMVQQLSQELNAANDENAQKQAKDQADIALKNQEVQVKQQQANIQWYEAQTDRIRADAEAAAVDPNAAAALEEVLSRQQAMDDAVAQLTLAHQTTQGQLAAVTDAHAALHDAVMPPDMPPQGPQAPMQPQGAPDPSQLAGAMPA